MAVNRQGVSVTPSGNAQGIGEAGASLREGEKGFYRTVPWIAGLGADFCPLAAQGEGGSAIGIQVVVENLPAVKGSGSVHVHPQRGDKPGQVGGTAGAAEPLLALDLDMGAVVVLFAGLREDLQGVDIEKASAVQGHSADHAVVKCLLHHICVFPLGFCFQHPAGEKYQADGRAGFSIDRIVGEIIIKGKGFPIVGGADRPRHIHPAADDAVPQGSAGVPEGFVAGLPGNVRHAAVQVDRPYRMALGGGLLPHRLARLIILQAKGAFCPSPGLTAFLYFLTEVIGLLAPLIDEVFRQTQVALLAGDIGQLYQGHLNNLVARIALELSLLGSEQTVHQVRVPPHGVQQLILTCGLIVGDSPFHQVSQAVQLVVVGQVGEAVLQAVDDIIGVQVPVRLLGGTDKVDGFIRCFFQLRVRMDGQGVSHRLDPLGKVAVLKDAAAKGPFLLAGRDFKVLHAVAGGSAFNPVIEGLPLIGNHLGADKVLKAGPEAAGNFYGVKVNGMRTRCFFFHFLNS